MLHKKYNLIFQPMFLLGDLVLLLLADFLVNHLLASHWSIEMQKLDMHYLIVPAIWTGIALILEIYSDRRNMGFKWIVSRTNTAFFMLAVFILFTLVLGKEAVSRRLLLSYLGLMWIFLLISVFLRHLLLDAIRMRGYNSRFLAFIGNKTEIHTLRAWIEKHPEYGYQKTRMFEANNSTETDDILKRIHHIAEIKPLDELALGKFHRLIPRLEKIIDLAEESGLRVRLVQELPAKLASITKMDVFGPFYVMNIRQEPLSNFTARLAKRVMDIAIALIVLIFFYWWLYLIIGLLIKASSKGPIVFTQRRVGKSGEHFDCYKFRSMRPNVSDKAGNGEITKRNDDRITWIGAILRRSNLDELPQFINVLKGDMSVVGPRPHMVEEDEKIAPLLSKYKIRRFVKPGITGWAAVNGYRGGTDNMELMQKRIDHDIYYIENWSPSLDTKIFFLTIWQMLTFTTKAY